MMRHPSMGRILALLQRLDLPKNAGNKHSSVESMIENISGCENVSSSQSDVTRKKCFTFFPGRRMKPAPGNTKGGSITVPLTSCLTGLESAL